MSGNAGRSVPMLDLKAQYARIGDKIDLAVQRVFESQHFILGPEVVELERELAAYCGCAYAVGCASGSDALLLGLMAIGIGQGDEVITSPYTFFATAGSIVRLGATPVFVDIERSTFNLDCRQLERAITKRTKAIMPVHLFGQCVDMGPMLKMAKDAGIAIIEDAAQAIGAEYDGRRAGSLGRVGAFSFYPTKNLGGAGDGGALTTNDQELAAKLSSLRTHGARKKYYHDSVGVNSRLDALQAAILRAKLAYLDEWADARRGNASVYRRLFAQSGLEERGTVVLPVEAGWGWHVYNQFVIRVEDRDGLRKFLAERGVGSEIYYPVSLHLQACFKDLNYKSGDLPESERAAEESLAIPIYPELSQSDQEYVVETIASFYGRD